MEKYQLTADPCDYRLIWCTNMLMMISCMFNLIGVLVKEAREIARVIDFIADVVYHVVSGCMTAQVSVEVDYQASRPVDVAANTAPVTAVPYHIDGGYKHNGGGYNNKNSEM